MMPYLAGRWLISRVGGSHGQGNPPIGGIGSFSSLKTIALRGKIVALSGGENGSKVWGLETGKEVLKLEAQLAAMRDGNRRRA